MSKREELRTRRERQKGRGQITIILLVVAGALLITAALILSNKPAAPIGNNTSQIQVTPITPKTFNTQVNGASLGDPKAKVRIDVWEDFQCPACKNYSEQIEPLVLQNYVETGKVYYNFHIFPFIDRGAVGGESHQAANAAMCALAQGRFWDYHDVLFANWNGENQGAFSNERLTAFAEYLSLDMTAFNACFSANTYSNNINKDYLDGQVAGVQGTPSVFVNGKLLTPGFIPSYDEISQAIEALLAGQ
jgi:protein-disulfide isomerase